MLKFKKTPDDGTDNESVVVRLPSELPWFEVVDAFIRFLLACGYYVTPQEVADYLTPIETDTEEDL